MHACLIFGGTKSELTANLTLLIRERGSDLCDEVIYKTDLNNVDWQEMKATLAADNFDNGRSPKQLQKSQWKQPTIDFLDDRVVVE